MAGHDHDDCVTRAELRDLVGIAELRELLGRRRGRIVDRSFVDEIADKRSFPEPLIGYQPGVRRYVRLWLRSDVERWLDRHRPGWREGPPAG